jgi:hypothetical protein
MTEITLNHDDYKLNFQPTIQQEPYNVLKSINSYFVSNYEGYEDGGSNDFATLVLSGCKLQLDINNVVLTKGVVVCDYQPIEISITQSLATSVSSGDSIGVGVFYNFNNETHISPKVVVFSDIAGFNTYKTTNGFNSDGTDVTFMGHQCVIVDFVEVVNVDGQLTLTRKDEAIESRGKIKSYDYLRTQLTETMKYFEFINAFNKANHFDLKEYIEEHITTIESVIDNGIDDGSTNFTTVMRDKLITEYNEANDNNIFFSIQYFIENNNLNPVNIFGETSILIDEYNDNLSTVNFSDFSLASSYSLKDITTINDMVNEINSRLGDMILPKIVKDDGTDYVGDDFSGEVSYSEEVALTLKIKELLSQLDD